MIIILQERKYIKQLHNYCLSFQKRENIKQIIVYLHQKMTAVFLQTKDLYAMHVWSDLGKGRRSQVSYIKGLTQVLFGFTVWETPQDILVICHSYKTGALY